MGDDAAMVASKPVWIDLSSADPAASRAFYAGLFGWDITVSPDPQYGGYAMATVGGEDVAGIGPTMSPGAPTAWMIYVGTPDAERVATDVQAAGGTVVAPPFDVGDQGRMAVFQDPTGAFISAWQPKAMPGFRAGASNMFVWAELNSRGIDRAVPFYERVFGWSHATQPMGEGMEYTEFHLGSDSIAGGVEMNPMVPAAVPSYWMVYFGADDVDAAFEKAIAAGAHEMLPPRDFPGGRFGILGDPQGAAFGILKMAQRQG
jgi:predicted enzyme related to lactoylglutathione lyase